MALPLYVPFGYFTFLVGLLWLFSRHYRSRALRRKPPPSWFPEPHTARDIYVSLLSMDPPPPQPVLISALLARAMTDVKRIVAVKEAKQAMSGLLQKGQVGDELWERLLMAEKELDVELTEVATEANEFSEGWGNVIFAVASEALQSTMCRDLYKNIEKQRALKTAEFNAARAFIANPGELRILGSKPAKPAAPAKPPAASSPPPSQAKLAMLENIRAAQAKLQEEEQKKQAAKQPASNGSNQGPSPGSSHGDQSDSDADDQSKSGPTSTSASKKKKPKKKKKN